jgi:glycosyltransferase involved in cell wall biosynthesis
MKHSTNSAEFPTIDAPQEDGAFRGLRLYHDAPETLHAAQRTAATNPLRVLVLRSVSGSGGGAEKIILRTRADCETCGIQLTACAIHAAADLQFDFLQRADRVNLEAIAIPQRWPGDPAVFQRLVNVMGAKTFDLIHSHDYKANFYAWRLGKRFDLPVVSTAHGWTGQLWRERAFYYPLDKRLLRRFDSVIGVSTEIAGELIRRGVPSERVTTLLNGVDSNRYAPDPVTRATVRRQLGFDEDNVVIGSVGRAERQKRFDLLIEAFAKLAPRFPQLRLLIVGAGSLLEELRAMVVRSGVESRCQLLGHRSDMLSLYQSMDMYVQSSEYEGTPTVLLEAMAMRLPIVATDVGGTTELAERDRHALIVPSHDIAALVEGVVNVLEDSVAASARVARARERIEHELSISNRTRQLAAIYAAAAANYSKQ